jgi:hypothetical protein
MISASVRSPTKADVSAAASSRSSSGLCSWRTSTVSGRAPWLRNALGPSSASRRCASTVERPPESDAIASSTSCTGSAAAAARSSCLQPVGNSSTVGLSGLSGSCAIGCAGDAPCGRRCRCLVAAAIRPSPARRPARRSRSAIELALRLGRRSSPLGTVGLYRRAVAAELRPPRPDRAPADRPRKRARRRPVPAARGAKAWSV